MPASNKFNRDMLIEAGYREQPDGSWEKREADTQAGNPSPQSSVVERSVAEKCKEPSRTEEERKESDSKSTRYQLVVVSYRARLIDSSNGCVKWIEDAIVKAGYMPDDAPQFCAAPIFHQVLVPTKHQKTEVYLFQLET